MADRPLVSVVIPTYNREATLKRAVLSVLAQDYDNLEVIVVDDGSTDRSQDVLRSIQDPRLRLETHAANRGLGAARNTGCHAARGDFLAFQDSDDEWLYGKLTAQMTALLTAGEEYVGVYCTKIVYGRDPERNRGVRRVTCVPGPEEDILSGDIRGLLCLRNVISTQTLICSRTGFERAGGFDVALRNSVDWDFVLRLSTLGKIAFVDEPLVSTYIQEDSVSRLSKSGVYSQIRITNKLKRSGVPDRVLAGHWERLGFNLGRNRHPVLALRLLFRALKARPFSVRIWFKLLVTQFRPRST